MHLKRGLPLVVAVMALSACAGLTTHPEAQVAFETGLTLFDQGRYAEAVPHFQRATELDPEFWRGYVFLGRSYLNLRRWAEAIPPLRAAWRISPEGMRHEIDELLLDALFGAATSAFTTGDFRTSVGYLKEILGMQPHSVQATQQLIQALLGLGSQMLSQGNDGAAIATYHEVTQLAPRNLDAYLGLARSSFQHGDLSQALSAVKDALRIAPTHFEALRLLHRIQSRE